jgi:TRIAD3 protein (E3 ubiquitin-protein ligase RNF216)
MNLQNVEAIPADSKKRTPTRPRINGSMVVNAEFDRELNWCADWYPGKPGEIEYILESGLDRAGQPPQNGQSVTPKKSEEEETIESEECESGEGIECGCCYSEYVVVSVTTPQLCMGPC